MLYRPASPAKSATAPGNRLFIALRTAFSAIFSAVAAQSADRRYLDGMRPSELEDIGLRRTDSRDYTSFR